MHRPGRVETRQARTDPWLTALPHCRRAVGHARTGARVRAERSLARAESAHEKAAGEPAAWLTFLTPAQLMGLVPDFAAAVGHLDDQPIGHAYGCTLQADTRRWNGLRTPRCARVGPRNGSTTSCRATGPRSGGLSSPNGTTRGCGRCTSRGATSGSASTAAPGRPAVRRHRAGAAPKGVARLRPVPAPTLPARATPPRVRGSDGSAARRQRPGGCPPCRPRPRLPGR